MNCNLKCGVITVALEYTDIGNHSKMHAIFKVAQESIQCIDMKNMIKNVSNPSMCALNNNENIIRTRAHNPKFMRICSIHTVSIKCESHGLLAQIYLLGIGKS